MFGKLAATMLLIVMTGLLAGCNGGRESDSIVYITAIGVDTADKEGKIKVTYQISIPRTLAAGQTASAEAEKTSFLITFTATNLAEARNLLNSTIARKANLSHVKIFLIGEAFARKGVEDMIGPIMRFREFRGSMFVAVVNQGTAENYMKNNVPKIEALSSRYYEGILLSDEETGLYMRVMLHDFYKQLKSGSGSPFVTLTALNKSSGDIKATGPRLPGEKSDEYEAGNIPRTGQNNPAEFIGMALFRHDKMIGTLTSEETRILSILRGHMKNSFLIVADPIMPKKNVNILIRLDKKPVIKGKLVDGKAVFDINAHIEGEITSISSQINYEYEQRRLLEEHASTILKRQIEHFLAKTQDMQTDPVGFGYSIRPAYGTYDEFQRQDWNAMYPAAEFNITVKCSIRRTGLMLKTTPIMNN